MDRARPLYREFPEEIVQFRLHWPQGWIAHGMSHVAEAVDILRLGLEEFRTRDLHRDFLMVSVDLADAQVVGGEMARALRLLAKTTPAWRAGTFTGTPSPPGSCSRRHLKNAATLVPRRSPRSLTTCAAITAATGTYRRPSSRSGKWRASLERGQPPLEDP